MRLRACTQATEALPGAGDRAWNQLGRADSMPDNFGSNLPLKLHFTVTTGTHAQPGTPGSPSASANEAVSLSQAVVEVSEVILHHSTCKYIFLHVCMLVCCFVIHLAQQGGGGHQVASQLAGGWAASSSPNDRAYIMSQERARSQPLARTIFEDTLCLGALFSSYINILCVCIKFLCMCRAYSWHKISGGLPFWTSHLQYFLFASSDGVDTSHIGASKLSLAFKPMHAFASRPAAHRA